jgi:hypothetical protein
MKRAVVTIIVSVLFVGLAVAQQPQTAQQRADNDALKEFTRSLKMDGLILNFVHLNNRTVELLFEGPTMYSMRARANQSTLVYVQGTPEKEIELDTNYVMEFEGDSIAGTSHNIKYFEEGTVPAGERIDGLIIFSTQVDLHEPFKIRGQNGSVTFLLSENALRMLGK